MAFKVDSPSKPNSLLNPTTRMELLSWGLNPLPRLKISFLSAMTAVYSVAYLLVGLAAIITWAIQGNNATIDLIKNLATISLGLFVAIVSLFFKLTEPA